MRKSGLTLNTACLGLLSASLLPALLPAPSAAAPACTGEACAAVTIADDGCTLKNASQKAVRLSIDVPGSAPLTTVLPAGETLRQSRGPQCVTGTPGGSALQANFAVLRQMPASEDVDFTLLRPLPRAKPAPDTLVAGDMPAMATVAPPAPPPPAPPPVRTPVPRSKPVLAAAPTGSTQPATMSPELAAAGPGNCGDACNEILFKTVDDCLWIQSSNPRAINFQAEIGGQPVALTLEGANSTKADVAPAVGAQAYHTRQHDPFLSTSVGIPVYRARLGAPGTCVKDRTEIPRFIARFVR